MFSVLFESGLRASEFCALNVGSVEFDQHGAVLVLPKNGAGLKTGARRIRLFDAVPYLHAWIEDHPFKDDASTALFHSDSRRAPKARMTPNALWKLVKDAGRQADLSKPINPHLFRHSATTERARLGWNESQMRAFFGWSRSSDMPSTYVHLAGLDYEKMELDRRGLLKDEEYVKPALSQLHCRVCNTDNLPTAMFCSNCRNPVSPEAEQALQERRLGEVREVVAKMVAESRREDIAAAIQSGLIDTHKSDSEVPVNQN